MSVRENPFRPDLPVNFEQFVGRKEVIQEISRYVDQSAKGRLTNFFVIGERGIGKTSLASYINNYAKKRCKMVGVHLLLEGTDTTDDLVKKIIEAILNEVSVEKWYQKIRDLFSNIETVGVGGLKIKFIPPEKNLTVLTSNFADLINEIITNMESKKDGLFIVLDDINGLTSDPIFANWYKSFLDTVATNFSKFPLTIMLVSLPDKRDSLFKLNPSIGRVFKVIELTRLSNSEVEDFFKETFDRIGISIEKNALRTMVSFTNGLPTMMHEIGDAIFWILGENETIITSEIVRRGVIDAGDNIGKKYLEPHVLSAIRSENYKSILQKLGKNGLFEFNIRDIEKYLNPQESRSLKDFLVRARELGIIDYKDVKGQGQYKFVNIMYVVYFMIND